MPFDTGSNYRNGQVESARCREDRAGERPLVHLALARAECRRMTVVLSHPASSANRQE